MLFNSFQFIVFFAITVLLYFNIPQKYRWILLLIGSCYFYMAFVPIYILILGFTILIDYVAAIYIEKSIGNKRKIFLILSLLANIGVLAIFKYYNFLNENFSFILKGFALEDPLPYLSILLPVGLSFHTFQAMSYTIEVYRGRHNAEKHFGIYALYVMFFPQLVAGPIERPQNLLPQFKTEHKFEYERVTEGLSLMLWGFFKKIVIADNLAGLVNIVYNNPQNFSGIHYILATILFAFQIFCDFSGYSDIALGAASIMGFKLMNNFNRPYFARSISDFWTRWHISLSTWFKDYVYIPLGGNREGRFKTYRNIFIIFLLSGLWHGANWTYVIWGSIHGTYLIISKMTGNIRRAIIDKLHINRLRNIQRIYQTTTVFLLVCFAWIFFRANSLNDALYIVKNLFNGVGQLIINFDNLNYIKEVLSKFNVGSLKFCTIWISIIFLTMVYYFKGDKSIYTTLQNKPMYLKWGFYYLLILSILFLGSFGEQPFIYFQF